MYGTYRDFEINFENFEVLKDIHGRIKVWRCGELVNKEISTQTGTFDISCISNFLNNYNSLSHKNLIEIVEVIKNESSICIISKYIQEPCSPFTDPLEALKFLKDCTDGLFYLQKNGVAHNDIKIENILKSSSGRYIIIDLDNITCESNFNNEKSEFIVGTKGYESPEKIELMKRLRFFYNAYKSDIFSLGISFLLLIIDEKYIEHSEINQKIESIPQSYQQFSSILKKMLDLDEEKRLDSKGLNQLIMKEFPIINSFSNTCCKYCKDGTVPLSDLFIIENKTVLCRRCLTERNKIDFELECVDCRVFSVKEYRCKCCRYCSVCKSSEHTGTCALGFGRKLGFIKCMHMTCDSYLVSGLSYFRKCLNGHFTCIVCRGSLKTDHKFCAFMYSL